MGFIRLKEGRFGWDYLCPVCGRTASESIREAREFLDAHIGEEVEDPGYFG